MSYFDYQVTARYIQCEHALKELKRYTYGLGKKFLILTACGPITEKMKNTVRESFDHTMEDSLMPEIAVENPRYHRQIAEARRFDQLNISKIDLEFLDMEGKEVTEKELRKLALLAEEKKVDVVIGIGGGKALDFARGTAFYTNIKCVLVPTAASTNAAATQICIINGEDGKQQEGCLFLANYPSLVIVDTSILIETPASSLAAGIADQMGSYFECLYSAKRLGSFGKHSDLCWESVENSIRFFFKYGKKAVEDAKAKKITHEYETILSMILHNSGLARSVSGSGFTHLLGKALTKLPACRASHGYQIGYGIIPMMVAEGEPEEKIIEYVDFCRDIGIPVRLEMFCGGCISEEELKDACDAVCQNPTPEVPFSAEDVVQSVKKAENLVGRYLNGE